MCAMTASCAGQRTEGRGEDWSLVIEGARRDRETPLTEAEIHLRIVNRGTEDVALDARFLNPILLFKIRTRGGDRVPPLPPSVPREFRSEDVFAVRPGVPIDIKIRLSELTADDLQGQEYRIQATYDSRGVTYPQGSKVLPAFRESNEATLRK